ncbi:MAG: hypothetical protein ACR2GR_04755 [Rhodothermales bacterium]
MFAPEAAQAQDHAEEAGDDEHSDSRFSDEPIPLANLPGRPRPIIEIGPRFLGTGTLRQGIKMPTGAVWQPAFLAWGNVRVATQGIGIEANDAGLVEAVGRFDLFGNLYLTQTERVVIGFRPLDQNGQFTNFTLVNTADPESESTFNKDAFNFGIRTLFFEGDFAELFPRFDWYDRRGLDYYISVGRQPLSFQDGLLINEDALDMVGLTRANLKPGRLVNLRVTGIFGWGDLNRPTGFGTFGDGSGILLGLFTETDTPKRTIELNAIWVLSKPEDISQGEVGGDGVYLGLGGIRRFGRYSNTLHVVGSIPTGEETLDNRRGVLIHNQFSWTPHHTYNHVYLSLFAGIESFRSAVRGPATGGPLGQTGILFSAVGLGRYGAALGSQADNSVGGSLGYQMFFKKTRHQLILEAGGRYQYQMSEDVPRLNDAVATGARYQLAVGTRGVIILDGFGAYDLTLEAITLGSRLEFLLKL